MTIYVAIHGVEPEDLKLNQREGENRHDGTALANLIYGSLKNREVDYQLYDVDHLADELSHIGENVTGVATVENADMHEKFTGRRPDYSDR